MNRTNDHTQFCSLICWVLAPGNSCQVQRKLAVGSWSSTKTSAVWFVELHLGTVTKSLKEAVADPTWVQSRIAARHSMWWHVLCTGRRKCLKFLKFQKLGVGQNSDLGQSFTHQLHNIQKQTNKHLKHKQKCSSYVAMLYWPAKNNNGSQAIAM